MLPEGFLITGIVTAVLVIACVMLHYEGLRMMSDRLLVPNTHPRWRVILMILGLLFLHIIEIWIFGVAYYIMLKIGGFGSLVDMDTVPLVDSIYYSATVYTTIGFGDIVPIGAIRTMTGTEGILGLTLITWSASYTFVEMLKTWNGDE